MLCPYFGVSRRGKRCSVLCYTENSAFVGWCKDMRDN